MDDVATLRPVSGSPRAVERQLARWLLSPEPEAVTLRTSGSTGEPKEVALSLAAVRASAAATSARLGGPGQWLLALPVHYVAGLQVVTRSLLAGVSPAVLDEHHSVAAAVAAMTGRRRYLSLVPTQLHRMLAVDADAEVLASLDAVLLGGSAAPPDLVEAARRRGIAVVTTYGMSETCGGCVYDGLPLDTVELAVAPDGRVLVRGPVLFDGYVGGPDLTAEVMRDGWLRTPDLGRLDPDGRLHLLGRADDVVVSGGVNVPLPVVERRLLEHPAVAQAAVLSIPDAEWVRRVVAVVVRRAGRSVDLAELRDFVGAVHPRTWAPRELVFVGELPMLESGKPDRQALLRSVQSGAGGAHG